MAMSRLVRTALLIGGLGLCSSAPAVASVVLDFKGTALPGAFGDVFIYELGDGPTTSFAGQPVDFRLTIDGPANSPYVSAFTLKWSDASYSFPYITGWSATGFPNDPSYDAMIGNQSVVTMTAASGTIDINSTSTYIAAFDGDLSFNLTYALSAPQQPGSSFTDDHATGSGSLDVTVNDNYDPTIGQYDAESSVSFDISSVTESAAPEAGTWAIMLAGLALVGTAARFRRNEGGQKKRPSTRTFAV